MDGAPPFFRVTFVVMLLGIPALLLGGGLLRNALQGALPRRGGRALDRALESHSWRALLAVAVMALAYPVLVRTHPRGLLAYAVFWLGLVCCFGPMLYWAWWHGQLPWQ